MKSLRRYLPFLALLLMLAGSITSCRLPPAPGERATERQAEQPMPESAPKARIETAWTDSVWLWPLAGYQAGEGILRRPVQVLDIKGRNGEIKHIVLEKRAYWR